MAKKLILWLGISVGCFTAFVLSVRAMEKETVSLTSADGQVEAVLELPDKPMEEITALQLSFQIEGGAKDVSFAFDAGLPKNSVQQYRYQEETGILSIYISGNENLYQNQNISLGKIAVDSETKASVRVIKNSFKTVNRAHGMYEGEVNTGDGGQMVNGGSPEESAGSQGADQITADSGIYGNHSSQSSGSGNRGEAKDASGMVPAPETGSVKSIMNTLLSGSEDSGMSGAGESTSEPEKTETKEAEPEETEPENSALREEGAGLWDKTVGAIDMEVWTKIFLGLFVGSTFTALAIGIGLIAQNSQKRRRRKRRKNVRDQSRQQPRKKQRRPQKMPPRQEQPVWKGKDPYVRKRRKIS